MRIAVAGFQHETNTFAPGNTSRECFDMADSWPGLLYGDTIISVTEGMNLPIAGAIASASQYSVDLAPVLWCAAEPGGYVTDHAFDSICAELLRGLKNSSPLDGIYLDLHGAMVTQSYQDGEGELLKRVRAEFKDIPVAISLDLHANITSTMTTLASLMTVYRTYPHLDMADTGTRCMQRLIAAIHGKQHAMAFRQLPFLIPLHAQYTGAAPCKQFYHLISHELESVNQWAELALGFTASDIYDCGPSIVAYAGNQTDADALAELIEQHVLAGTDQFDLTLLSEREAVHRALSVNSGKPVVIADVQDNPGAGATSDTTGLLRELFNQNACNAVIGVMCDPDFATQAQQAGTGAIIKSALGAKSGLPGHSSISENFKVLVVSNGEITYSGEMYGGGVAELGPCCLVTMAADESDIKIVVSTTRIQCLDRALFTHFGIDLESARIICVKSTVHHRADFEPISSEIINTASAGVFACKLALEDYHNLRPDMQVLA